MHLQRRILTALEESAQSSADVVLGLSVLERCVSFISFCIFVARCIHYLFIKPRPENCGTMMLKFKESRGFYSLKIGLLDLADLWKLKIGLSVFIITFKATLDLKKLCKIPKCKVKISISFFKWTLAYKGKKMVIHNCDKLPNTNCRPKDGNTS